jgi:hypothetical protein
MQATAYLLQPITRKPAIRLGLFLLVPSNPRAEHGTWNETISPAASLTKSRGFGDSGGRTGLDYCVAANDEMRGTLICFPRLRVWAMSYEDCIRISVSMLTPKAFSMRIFSGTDSLTPIRTSVRCRVFLLQCLKFGVHTRSSPKPLHMHRPGVKSCQHWM